MKHSRVFVRIVNDAKLRVNRTTPRKVKEKLDRKDRFVLVDVREDNEWKKGHIAGAVHIGKGVIERDIDKHVPDKKEEIILYCGGGYRSALAADNLQKMGYKNVLSMDGGWREWKNLKYPRK
jgi:rhodanese-related sulfurtransferase